MTARFVPYLPKDREDELRRIARALIAPGKGILAADESNASMHKRLDMIKMENNEENRRKFREMLLCCGKEMSEHIGGCILFHETLYQKANDGVPFVKHLQQNGVVPGIKVDMGVVPLAGSDAETTTQGLDNLAERCAQYKKDGAHFTKWRCTLKIQQFTPTYQAMIENANVLARYASISQQNRLVPIIEPEILPDGNHDIETTKEIAEKVLQFVMHSLAIHNVFLEGLLLKVAMVTPGFKCPKRNTADEIASFTLSALQRRIPPAIPGIVFLSGGMAEDEATANLNAMNKLPNRPWALSFSFARALQTSATLIWHGKEENQKAAREEMLKIAKANGLATLGKFQGNLKTFASGKNTFVADNAY
ncbi:hypothetical protein HELRODRAFT_91686 [Helobdella robusta]|uniref:Fructose-bisphosphate aldolase n=1 Tax=Helobdella robusta TaxID=6412 RepID=T1G880_HELRO|nr:hypothetical protein HELRODRAFT_91686 [Helobdella robusta]ESO11108.1 hypothetical protein HELRODRAFT_91686 [Helobdella robusta]